MQPTYLRDITEDEKNNLYDILDNDTEADYRAKIILLRSEGYTVGEIRRQTNRHDSNIRKWIHRFNSHVINGIVSRKHNHTAPKTTDDIEKAVYRSMQLVIGIVVFTYIFLNISLIGSVGSRVLANSQAPLATASGLILKQSQGIVTLIRVTSLQVLMRQHQFVLP